MKDTHPEIEELSFRMMMEKSGEERLKMGLEMCNTAKRLVIASIIHENPDALRGEIKSKMFDRFYENDLPQEVRQNVMKSMRDR
ncbi:MAG: hypothetical protein HZB54_07625 [Deltaproteobacteria bacterium]|nr:hypothetical protein [Deltaproteobacteria bacterium]